MCHNNPFQFEVQCYPDQASDRESIVIIDVIPQQKSMN